MGEISDGDIELKYFNNKKYYDQKFGLGKQWRKDHSPVEPKDIKYNPAPSALAKNYPKIFVE